MAATKQSGKVLICTEHFSYEGEDGRPLFIHAGQRVAADHPAVAGRESLFRDKGPED
jgi:hypothetical protein